MAQTVISDPAYSRIKEKTAERLETIRCQDDSKSFMKDFLGVFQIPVKKFLDKQKIIPKKLFSKYSLVLPKKNDFFLLRKKPSRKTLSLVEVSSPKNFRNFLIQAKFKRKIKKLLFFY